MIGFCTFLVHIKFGLAILVICAIFFLWTSSFSVMSNGFFVSALQSKYIARTTKTPFISNKKKVKSYTKNNYFTNVQKNKGTFSYYAWVAVHFSVMYIKRQD